MQNYNIYCDESSIDNPKNDFMVIGAIFIEREMRDELKQKIKEIREKHNYFAELKWSKFNKKILGFGKDIVDLFFEYSDEKMSFHCIVVDKLRVQYEVYHGQDKELAFYKFIYQLLQYKFLHNSVYYIFLDNKENSNPDRIKNLKKYLDIVTLNRYVETEIKHIQSYCSKEMQLIQLADLFTGAVGYRKNNFGESEAKQEISKYISEKLGKEDLDFKSSREDKKFNIFQINL